MSNIAIKVENISKAYQLGDIGTGTISNDLERWWARVRGKEDPFLKIGQTNDRTAKGEKGEVVWSLKDINFEIEQGQAVGIIGRNGAGKSTLLKILSRVTAPTTGSVKLKGRVASLLEVGTGFHPELSGRENIFLNGAILGMRKAEIKSKLDEIIDFAGVEKYIDTPVKRYSSGMYVRLAFAVAAHLEPEILIVDEVLAVGDAEFQKKCLGKMNDVNQKEGRTVLFVSHNMKAVEELCTKCILLNKGFIELNDLTEFVVNKYFDKEKSEDTKIGGYFENINLKTHNEVNLVSAKILNSISENTNEIKFREPFSIVMKWQKNVLVNSLAFAIRIFDNNEKFVCAINTLNSTIKYNAIGEDEITLSIDLNFFVPGEYFLNIGAFIRPHSQLDLHEKCVKLIITDQAYKGFFKYNIVGEAMMALEGKWILN